MMTRHQRVKLVWGAMAFYVAVLSFALVAPGAHGQMLWTKPPRSIATAIITSGTLDGVTIGGTTPGAGTFTSLTTTTGNPSLTTSGGTSLNFGVNGASSYWQITVGGAHLLAVTDNQVDIGASGANRPRTIYTAVSVVTPLLSSPSATFPINGLAAAAGGSVTISGGAGGTTTGGAVAINGGTATSGAGSNITVTAGSGAGGTNAGGDVNLVPGAAVSTGTPGEVKINSARGVTNACWQQYLPASVPVTATSYTFFVANRAFRVTAASIIASSTTTPTVDVTKDTGTNAPGAGTSVLTGVMTFSGSANTRVVGTITGTVATTNLAAGDRLAAKWGGTVGALTGGMLCVTLVPI